ncbi:MAG TPA: hypothetical protein VHQ46_06045, partial [Desulfobacteria bacterium]|nr:hypothetical protein [Desulfobacteria bacterium]
MFKKLIIGAVVTGMLVSLVGCGNSSSSQQPTQQKQAQSSQLPPGHPGIGTTGNSAATTNATVTPAQVEKQINDVLAKDFPGDWKVSGSNLSKGSYVENNNYKIVDKIAAEIPNTISASIFVDKKRIATSMVVGGKRQLDYEISD